MSSSNPGSPIGRSISELLAPRVLTIAANEQIATAINSIISAQGWQGFVTPNSQQAMALLSQTVPDVAIVDVELHNDNDLATIAQLRNHLPDLGIIVLSSDENASLTSRVAELGADHFLSKPVSITALVLSISKLFELREERRRSNALEQELRSGVWNTLFPEIQTNNDAMKAVLKLVKKVGSRDLSVLIWGESGTGKELVARSIHQISSRSQGNFVELNCAALPPNLVESELFGHEKGAFTGAVASRAGKIELASGGTLFLDEIGELPLEIQPKLLRALQDKRITRVGADHATYCDFRLVCATNRDLAHAVRNGQFREDLFYRISTFPIRLPALRERREDIDLLLEHFLRKEGIRASCISLGARRLLHNYSWPGNVRELLNFTQAVTVMTEAGQIDEDSVHAYFGSRISLNMAEELPAEQPAKRPIRTLADVERQEIEYALTQLNGDVTAAASALGIGRATLYNYMRKAKLNSKEFQN